MKRFLVPIAVSLCCLGLASSQMLLADFPGTDEDEAGEAKPDPKGKPTDQKGDGEKTRTQAAGGSQSVKGDQSKKGKGSR